MHQLPNHMPAREAGALQNELVPSGHPGNGFFFRMNDGGIYYRVITDTLGEPVSLYGRDSEAYLTLSAVLLLHEERQRVCSCTRRAQCKWSTKLFVRLVPYAGHTLRAQQGVFTHAAELVY